MKVFVKIFFWLAIFSLSVIFFKTPFNGSIPKSNDNTLEIKAALDECQNPDQKKLTSCFREKIKPVVLSSSAAQTITTFQQIYTNNQTAGNYSDIIACHTLSHIIGEIDGENSRNVGQSLSKCTPDCGNACYHGILIGALKSHPDLLDNLPSVCESFSGYNFPGQQLTACRHGLGHGLAEFTANDTIASLNYCDRLQIEIAKVECGSGVFMETIDDAVAGTSAYTLPEDIGNFCLQLNQPYLDLCTRNVGNYKFRTTNSIPAAFLACQNISTKYSDSCFNSLGADFFFIVKGQPDKLYEVCQAAPAAKVDTCLEGSIISSLVTDPLGNLSAQICNLSASFKDKCLTQLSSHLLKLQGAKYREEFCHRLVYNIETCLGAR